jgi:hypothetical protein
MRVSDESVPAAVVADVKAVLLVTAPSVSGTGSEAMTLVDLASIIYQ